MTTTKTLKDGTQCIKVHVVDGENEVRVHWHDDAWEGVDTGSQRGLLVKSASLGTICDVGDVVGECD